MNKKLLLIISIIILNILFMIIPVYGLTGQNDSFSAIRIIIASFRGTIMEIGPIALFIEFAILLLILYLPSRMKQTNPEVHD
ncbi:MAG: hypothetical protein INQ03_21005 [Candidatus Heimdallarchaeota archaeon]|nr:hypothetical protein [Candidatus Heimdallarchaeota archaeon]